MRSLLQRPGRTQDMFMVMDVKPCTYMRGGGGGGSMTGPGLLTRSPARKTHVSLGRTGSLPSSTGLGVYSPDLQILSSSSASPLPAWCSQSCSVSVQKMQDRIIIAFQKEVLCICKFFFFFLAVSHLKNMTLFTSRLNHIKGKNI